MKFNTTDFFEKLQPLISRGISLNKALTIINHNLKNPKIENINKKIQEGSDLSMALSQFSTYFSKIDIALIKAGETSGKLSQFLQKLIDYRRQQTKITRQIKKALFYPMLVFGISLAISIFLLIVIVPQFQTIFSSFGASLPWITQEVIIFSKIISNNYFIFLLITFVLIVLLKAHNISSYLKNLALRIPLLGNLIKKNYFGLSCYLLAITQQSGISLIDGLEMAKQASGLSYFQNTFSLCQKELQQGALLSETLKNQALLDIENIALLEVGEATATLPAMLIMIAERFANSAELQLEYISKLIEPCIMLILALIAGTLIVAMYLPIFSMGMAIH